MRLSRSDQPVSVCFVIDRLSRAGTETQLIALISHLDRRAVSPSLCVLNGGDSESRSLCPDDCPFLDLGLPKIASPNSLSAAARLASFWRRHRVEVVQTYFLDSTYFAAPLARLCGVPHVVRVRNNTGYWLTARHRMLGRLTAQLGVTLTNSEDATTAIRRVERLKPGSIATIENGVDLDRFPDCLPPNIGRMDVQIGAVANLRPVKNIGGLVDAATILRDEFPQARFIVAGEGPARSELESQIRRAGLDDRFLLRGAVQDVPGFLSQIDIAVLCSHSESMSNALLEYMAAGRAIVATDVGSNARLIRDGIEGSIVPPGDSRALAHAIRQFIRAPELARRCAGAARTRAEQSFSRRAMIRRFENFYETLGRGNVSPTGRASRFAA